VLLDDHVFPDLTRNNTIIKFYKARSISVVNNFSPAFLIFMSAHAFQNQPLHIFLTKMFPVTYYCEGNDV